MKRKDFLKNLGIVTVGLAVTPKLIDTLLNEKPTIIEEVEAEEMKAEELIELPQLYVGLFTADNKEVDYDGYQRVPVERSENGWIIYDDECKISVKNKNDICFPRCKNDGYSISGFFIANKANGGDILMEGELNRYINLDKDTTPIFMNESMEINIYKEINILKNIFVNTKKLLN